MEVVKQNNCIENAKDLKELQELGDLLNSTNLQVSFRYLLIHR